MSPVKRLRRGAHAPPDIAARARPVDTPARTRRRHRAERWGRLAETYVALRLALEGWRVLGRRVRTPAGEIDLVALRGGTLAFVEIKARGSWAEAERAIAPRQRERIARAAGIWLDEQRNETLASDARLGHIEHRFDAVFVVGPRIRHVADAWRAGDEAAR